MNAQLFTGSATLAPPPVIPTGPESSLAAAIIAQALGDLSLAAATDTEGRNDFDEAWQFLTATSGRWAASRTAWAEIAGVSPVALRHRAIAMLAEQIDTKQESVA